MEIHRLRIFATIARAGSVTRAAESLFLTQPTASQQLALLEAEVGARLIERSTRRHRLTPAGETLLRYAEQILALAQEAADAARAAAGIAERTLRLGAGHAICAYLLPDLLRRYRERYPERRVRIQAGNTAELLDLVASGVVEVALVGTPARRRGIEILPFHRDRLLVIVPPADAWAERKEITLAELRERPLLTREPGSALHASAENLLGAGALSREDVTVLPETEAIKRSVEAGLGIALIQAIAIEREVAAGTLRALELADAQTERDYACAYRRRTPLSPAARDLLSLLRSRRKRRRP